MNSVAKRLKKFMSFGFKLNNKAIISILNSFKDRLYDIGEILWDAFFKIRSDEINNLHLSAFLKGLRESFKNEEETDDVIQSFLQYMEIKRGLI
jgi:hypothetical protein